MYTANDYQKNRAQLHRRMIIILIPALILLGLIIWSFIARVKWLTMGLTIVMGALLIFCYGLYLFPLIAYGRHLQDALTGRTRSTSGTFKEMESSAVQREGVMYFPMLISVGDPSEPEDDRLFYYDAELPNPGWQAGEGLAITSHDKFVTSWTRV